MCDARGARSVVSRAIVVFAGQAALLQEGFGTVVNREVGHRVVNCGVPDPSRTIGRTSVCFLKPQVLSGSGK